VKTQQKQDHTDSLWRPCWIGLIGGKSLWWRQDRIRLAGFVALLAALTLKIILIFRLRVFYFLL
jgi:hypothetical protein